MTKEYCEKHRWTNVVRQAVAEKHSLKSFDELGYTSRKLRVLHEQKHKCLLCGQDEIWNRNKLVLQLDHVDGNRKNNSRVNLRMLCPNCHSQTETFGTKNAPNKECPTCRRTIRSCGWVLHVKFCVAE